MARTVWLFVSKVLPLNGASVWCRVSFIESVPFLCTFNSSTDSFTVVATGIIYPAYVVTVWRPE